MGKKSSKPGPPEHPDDNLPKPDFNSISEDRIRQALARYWHEQSIPATHVNWQEWITGVEGVIAGEFLLRRGDRILDDHEIREAIIIYSQRRAQRRMLLDVLGDPPTKN